MKIIFVLSVVLLITISCLPLSSSAPASDTKDQDKDSKSAFGPAFDEIVVESSLTVRRKPTGRQAKNQNVTEPSSTSSGIIKTKRDISRETRQNHHHKSPGNAGNKGFGASAANSQAQAFNSFGPLGSFGASATGAQTQSFGAGPNGLMGAAGFSGTQQYNFNGQTIDIAFGNAFAGANGGNSNAGGSAITVTGADGKKRPFNG